MPWLRRLAAGLPPRRPGFDPGSVRVGFVVDKVALGEVLPRVLRFSPVNFHSTGSPLLGKGQKIIIIIVIFITGLHKKPQGCGASVASAAAPFTTTTPEEAKVRIRPQKDRSQKFLFSIKWTTQPAFLIPCLEFILQWVIYVQRHVDAADLSSRSLYRITHHFSHII
jgi:hypothetical protein